MQRFLTITVGGSCAPIVSSISRQAPDFVVFLCSDDSPGVKGSYRTVDGAGLVCGRDPRAPDEPSIVTQVGLHAEQYEVVRIQAFDDPNSCYRAAHQALTELRCRSSEASLAADYTGGTKSMSVGLVLAALDIPGVTLSVVKGDRVDLIRVQDGTSRVGRVGTSQILVERELTRARELFKAFDYPALVRSLEGLAYDHLNLVPNQEDRIQSALTLARGLEAWDRFNHDLAWRILLPHRKAYPQLVLFLEAVVHSRRLIDKGWGQDLQGLRDGTPGHGYELVEDLLLNAGRRAKRGRYDDAVGRLYRALELLAQLQLSTAHGVQTSDVDVERLPVQLHSDYLELRDRSGKVRLGLLASYRLLADLEDRVGTLFVEWEKRLLRALEMRNHSILAHGFRPVVQTDYAEISGIVSGFCNGAIQDLVGTRRLIARAEQFPAQGSFPAETLAAIGSR